jgi:hypothetical protein
MVVLVVVACPWIPWETVNANPLSGISSIT